MTQTETPSPASPSPVEARTRKQPLSWEEGLLRLKGREAAPAAPSAPASRPEAPAPQAAGGVQSDQRPDPSTEGQGLEPEAATREDPAAGAAAEEEAATGDATDPVLFTGQDGTPVTRSQVEEWRKGHLRQDDYTRKTTELAEQRKALKPHEERIEEARRVIAGTLELHNQFVQQQRQTLAAMLMPPQELAQTDPVQFMLRRDEARERLAAFDQQAWQLQQAAQQAGQAGGAVAEGSRAQRAQAEYAKLLDKLPRWRDQQVAQREGAEAKQTLLDAGFGEEELLDHRLYVLARDAAIGRRVVDGGKAGAAAKAAGAGVPSMARGEGSPANGRPVKAREIEAAKAAIAGASSLRERQAAGTRYLQLRRGVNGAR